MKNSTKNIQQKSSIELSKNTESTKKFIWEVTPTSTPLFKRKCSKCRSSDLYYCSDKFRLNSQKKNIDVWLIYRCIKCNDTCNITILSRTKPELIDKDLFLRFSENDKSTAWKYAFDIDTARRNKMELDYHNVEYNIECENITLEDILQTKYDTIEFVVKTKFDLNLKLISLIRRYFNLSANQSEKMCSTDVITTLPTMSIKKCKIKNDVSVIIDCKKLKQYLDEK